MKSCSKGSTTPVRPAREARGSRISLDRARNSGRHANPPCFAAIGKGLPGAMEVFVEAYHRLMRSAIRKLGIRDTGMPSADDVFRDTFQGLHQYFRKGG